MHDLGCSQKSVLIYGAGSIGSYLAAKLYSKDYCVDVVGRSKVRGIGNLLYINDVPHKFPKVSDEGELKGFYNYVFVTSKYYDLRHNLEKLIKLGIKYDVMILIQNTYIDNIWYYDLVKSRPIIGISIYEGFNLDGNKLALSPFSSWHVENDLLGRDIYNILKDSGVNVTLTDDIRVKRAEKTVINCTLNLLSSIYIIPEKVIISKKDLHSRAKKIFNESYDVLSQIIKMRSKRAIWTEIYDTMKNSEHFTSSCQDVMKNKKTELSFLNGFVVDLGNKIGIKTPENQRSIEEFKAKYPNLY